MTVAVGARTRTGSYSILVTGSAGGIQKTAQLMLTVTAQVFLHWDRSESGNVVGYNLARSTQPGYGYTRINSSLITNTFYSDQTVQSGHTYYYVATAVDDLGNESPPSNQAVAAVD
jgi:fibronectin type 3 domain-containing protein